MVEFKGVPTKYNGIQFRSRLEARWAATFDHLGWEWIYEPIDLPGWMPDFCLWVPPNEQISRPFLVDVKPFTKYRDLYLTTPKIERAMEGRWGSYEALIIALHPLKNHHQFHDSNYDFDALSIGWRGMGDLWTPAAEMAKPEAIESAWKTATNATQWKRPA